MPINVWWILSNDYKYLSDFIELLLMFNELYRFVIDFYSIYIDFYLIFDFAKSDNAISLLISTEPSSRVIRG